MVRWVWTWAWILPAVQLFGQDSLSWADALIQKEAVLELVHTEFFPQTFLGKDGKWAGVDQEILQEFQKFCLKKYGVRLTFKQNVQPRFAQIFSVLKKNKPNTLVIGSISITDERKQNMDFSIPYMPDLELLVTNKNIPYAHTEDSLLRHLSNKTALFIRGTTFEENLKNLVTKHSVRVHLKECSSVAGLIQELVKNSNSFSYLEFTRYLLLIREGKHLNRQDLFMVKRDGYGFALPIGSDWKIPLNEFITDSTYLIVLRKIIGKYYPKDITEITLKSYQSNTFLINKQYDILLAEKNYQRLQLIEQELALRKESTAHNFLTVAIIFVVVILGGLIHRNRYITKTRSELLIKNREINFTKNELENKTKEIETQRDQLANALETVTVLGHIGRQLISQRSIEPILISVYQHINKMMLAQEFTIGLANPTGTELHIPVWIMNGQRMYFPPIPLDNDNRISIVCYKQKRDFLIGDISQEIHNYIKNKNNYQEGDLLNSLVCVPLLSGSKSIGFLSVQCDSYHAYNEFHLNILKNLSLYIVTALGNAEAFSEIMSQKQFLQQEKKQREDTLRKLESAYDEVSRVNSLLENDNLRKTNELLDAQKVQMAMLPKEPPTSSNYRISYNMMPAYEVGGDYFDFKQFDNELLVTIGDATGHGYRAGIIVATAKSYFQSLAKSISLTNGLVTISQGIRGLGLRSAFMGMHLIRLESNFYEIATAGMPPVWHFQAKHNEWKQIYQKGLFLGTNFPERYTSIKIPFETNDKLVLLSDGFTEMFNENKKQPENQDIINVLNQITAETDSSETLHKLQYFVHNWIENSIQQDDITIVVIQRTAAI